MKSFILQIEPKQTFESSNIDLEEGVGILPGFPYGCITLSGDGFLFGFIAKPKFPHDYADIDALIKKIEWIETD